jgi:hypothetical protein
MQAATQACYFQSTLYQPTRSVDPGVLLAIALKKDGRHEEALVWRARTIMHCQEPDPEFLSRLVVAQNTKPQERLELLSLLLLSGDSAHIAQAQARVPAEELAAARSQSAELRQRVAQSVREYPAPQRKKMP